MEVSTEDKAHYEKRRRQFYVGGLSLVAVITVFEVAFHYEKLAAASLYFAARLVLSIGPMAWCIYDALARGFRLSIHRVAPWLLFGPISIVVYFFCTRGFAQSAKWLFGLALYLPYYAVDFAMWHLTEEVLVNVGYFSPE